MDKRNRKALEWQESEWLEWSCLHFPPPFTSHYLTPLQTHCRLTSRWVLQDSGPALPGVPKPAGDMWASKMSLLPTKNTTPRYFLCSHTYQQLVLVNIFCVSWRIFDLFAKHQRDFKEKQMPLTAFPNERLGIPHLEGILKNQLSLDVQVLIKP